jgi:hypothetical protein
MMAGLRTNVTAARRRNPTKMFGRARGSGRNPRQFWRLEARAKEGILTPSTTLGPMGHDE